MHTYTLSPTHTHAATIVYENLNFYLFFCCKLKGAHGMCCCVVCSRKETNVCFCLFTHLFRTLCTTTVHWRPRTALYNLSSDKCLNIFFFFFGMLLFLLLLAFCHFGDISLSVEIFSRFNH